MVKEDIRNYHDHFWQVPVEIIQKIASEVWKHDKKSIATFAQTNVEINQIIENTPVSLEKSINDQSFKFHNTYSNIRHILNRCKRIEDKLNVINTNTIYKFLTSPAKDGFHYSMVLGLIIPLAGYAISSIAGHMVGSSFYSGFSGSTILIGTFVLFPDSKKAIGYAMCAAAISAVFGKSTMIGNFAGAISTAAYYAPFCLFGKYLSSKENEERELNIELRDTLNTFLTRFR